MLRLGDGAQAGVGVLHDVQRGVDADEEIGFRVPDLTADLQRLSEQSFGGIEFAGVELLLGEIGGHPRGVLAAGEQPRPLRHLQVLPHLDCCGPVRVEVPGDRQSVERDAGELKRLCDLLQGELAPAGVEGDAGGLERIERVRRVEVGRVLEGLDHLLGFVGGGLGVHVGERRFRLGSEEVEQGTVLLAGDRLGDGVVGLLVLPGGKLGVDERRAVVGVVGLRGDGRPEVGDCGEQSLLARLKRVAGLVALARRNDGEPSGSELGLALLRRRDGVVGENRADDKERNDTADELTHASLSVRGVWTCGPRPRPIPLPI